MPPLTQRGSGRRYWRSMEELADAPEFRSFLTREFPALATELEASASRRTFLKLMGASFALAGVTSMTGCVRWPKEAIAPYPRRPKNRTPGVPVHYATTIELGGVGTGLLAKSFDGRPIKLEGNPEHAGSLGASSALQQASVLSMYDPDRSKRFLSGGGPGRTPATADWPAFQRWLAERCDAARGKRGAGFCILSEATSSVTIADLKARLLQTLPEAEWFEYEALDRDNEREGLRQAFGSAVRPLVDFAAAERVVTFADDFLGDHPNALAATRAWARTRVPRDGKMSRLYAVESSFSLTGSNADVRFAEPAHALAARLLQLAAALRSRGVELPAGLGAAPGTTPGYVDEIAADLVAHRGHAIVLAGPGLPPAAHTVVAAINRALNAPLRYARDPAGDRPGHVEALTQLAERLSAGGVDTLLILGGNPVYTAPADVDFAAALAKAAHSAHLSEYVDETSALCEWHAPRAHYLESWGDARGWDGQIGLTQPLILPLYGGITPAETLSACLGDARPGADLVRAAIQARWTGSPEAFESHWQQTLHDGVLRDSAFAAARPELRPAAVDAAVAALRSAAGEAPAEGFELHFAADRLYDGRFANNGWLQELPHPLTKLTWDNAALISPADAAELGVARNDIIAIELGATRLNIPVYVLPGQARGTLTLPLGYARERGGQVAAGSGFATHKLRRSNGMWVAAGARVTRLGQRFELATTQDHHAIQSQVGAAETQVRIPQLAREATLAAFQADRHVVRHFAHSLPLVQPWEGVDYSKVKRWGMTIDLARCTGCSACVVACQAENNIAVVGRDEVKRGREMAWLRIDRYFAGDAADEHVEVRHQPVMCVQCENAPCEQVCPVAATVHDSEGLNVMVYNRCIGTRYCNNNCPYKVRRFNWFYNHHGPYHPRSNGEWAETKITPVETMVFNPDVTVRSRGVMEKCTYCLQRITEARIAARNDEVQGSGDGAIPDGTITTACQQACPAEVIAFGDLNQPDARVTALQDDDRAYAMLDYLNIRPRTKYLMGLRNPLHDDGGGHGGHGQEAAHGAQQHG